MSVTFVNFVCISREYDVTMSSLLQKEELKHQICLHHHYSTFIYIPLYKKMEDIGDDDPNENNGEVIKTLNKSTKVNGL